MGKNRHVTPFYFCSFFQRADIKERSVSDTFGTKNADQPLEERVQIQALSVDLRVAVIACLSGGLTVRRGTSMSCRRSIRVPYSPPALGRAPDHRADRAQHAWWGCGSPSRHSRLAGDTAWPAYRPFLPCGIGCPTHPDAPPKSKRTLLAVDAIQVPLVLRSELAERRLSRRGQ